MQKRIIHEINRTFPELREKHNIRPNIRIIEQNSNSNEINCIEIYDNTNTLFFMDFTTQYPFRPPKLTLNNTLPRHYGKDNYDRWAIDFTKDKTNIELELAYIFTVIRQPLAKKYIRKIPNSKSCFCCDTILCVSNWSPSIDMFHITMEYLCRDIFRSYLSTLRFRQMLQIFDNDNWSLNNDLLFCIISHL